MGEAVQYSRAFTELLDRKSVIFLIKEKSCLLTILDIDNIFDTVFRDLHISVKFLSDKAFDTLHAFIQTYLGIASLIDSLYFDAILSQYFL